jgi:hypothetical protein
MQAWSARGERSLGRGDRLENLVLRDDLLKGLAGAGLAFRRHQGHRVAHVARELAHGDKARPIVHDVADVAFAGYVLPSGDDGDTGQGACRRYVQPREAGAGVRRPERRAEEHARRREVVDVQGATHRLFDCVDSPQR